MTYPHFQWRLPATTQPPDEWCQAIEQWATQAGIASPFLDQVEQLLWQRGWQTLDEIQGLLNSADYQPTSPCAFGMEMEWAIARLVQAHHQSDKVAIWGDFDADGLTATAVLWEGLGQFFAQDISLRYYVPNRFTESHGLSRMGVEVLAEWGCTVIVTCDTGSTAHAELEYAQALGMDVIVTDHHTLPDTRPPLVALVNPRQLPVNHPLSNLSGVAVAYKLLEALYAKLPTVPQQPLETVLDLVAIGLIADLVELKGDCRYLAQIGLQRLEEHAKSGKRPGVAKLLELCKRTGDRPSDVAFGIGPRINAISRIHGDASFGVELLTSQDRATAEALALEAELANTRRKELQATVMRQAQTQLATWDLSTTQVIILSDPQWSPGVLGLVANQIAQEHGRPTILFQVETTAEAGQLPMARGSARSVRQIDLYELVKGQSHLLTSFGGHPFAAGMSLPVKNLPLLAEGMNRAVRSQLPTVDLTAPPPLDIDLEITVGDLGKALFRALKLLEPYGMGNPVPRLLLKNVQIGDLWEDALWDRRGGKQRYYKLSFTLTDPQTRAQFPGHWWGHRRTDLPGGGYDLVVELDVNTYKKRYEARLIDLQPTVKEADAAASALGTSWLVDRRGQSPDAVLVPTMLTCPADWSDFMAHHQPPEPLTLAYPPPEPIAPDVVWQRFLGVAKFLARTGDSRPMDTVRDTLAVSDRTLLLGLNLLRQLGFTVQYHNAQLQVQMPTTPISSAYYEQATQAFLAAIQEEHFRRQYFSQVSKQTLQQVLQSLNSPKPERDG